MRRTLFALAAAFALTALAGTSSAGASSGNSAPPAISAARPASVRDLTLRAAAAVEPAEADADGDDSTVSLAAAAEVRLPEPAVAGDVDDSAPSVAERDSRATPLCRGRPGRDPRTTSPSRPVHASPRFFLDRVSILFPADPAPRRLSPHPRP